MSKRDLKFEFASRERIGFLKPIEKLLLRLLRQSKALISDETLLWDFCADDAEDAIGLGSRPHWYRFEQKWRRSASPAGSQDESMWHVRIYEARAVPFRKMLVRKVLRHTGVNIDPVFDEYFPAVLHYISANMPDDKRKKLLGR